MRTEIDIYDILMVEVTKAGDFDPMRRHLGLRTL